MKIFDIIKKSKYVSPIEKIHNKHTKVCFVNFANGSYISGQQDLIRSIKKHSSYDILAFTKYEEIGSPSHHDSPYEFKLHSIKTARDKGYEIVIWCDASMRLIKSIDDLIPKIKEVGVYVQQDGWYIGQWANDKTLDYFGTSRDDMMKIQNASAGIIGFDFKNSLSNIFLNELFKCSHAGLFVGKWNNKDKTESQDERCLGHRHDQTCIELVSYKLNIQKQPMLWGTNPSYAGRYFTIWNHL